MSYGVDFGTPTFITWYKDGSVVATMGQGGTNLNGDGGLFLDVTAARGTGIYKAVVVANGENYTTNEFEISSAEDAAVMTAFNITNDYTVDGGVVFKANDTKAIVTIKMDKNFQGIFKIYKATDTKFANAIDTLETAPYNAAPTASAAAVTSANAGFSVAATTEATGKDILSKTPGSGLAFISSTGDVTYKWYSDQLRRGTDYVLVFDQASLTSDNIGRGNENVYEDAETAPYVMAPTKVAITKLVKNAPIEVTFYTSDDEAMTFAGIQTAIAGPDAIGVKTGSALYSGTKTGLATGDATKHVPTLTTGSSLKAGVWTTDVAVAGTDAFWFANITFNKGIYGQDEFTLRSEDVQVAQDVATGLAISYDQSSPKDLTVKFTNLRGAGTLYVAALTDSTARAQNAATVADETPSAGYARVYADPTLALTSVSVSAGADKVTIEDIVQGITVGDGTTTGLPGNSYFAFVVPDDENSYSPAYTATAAAITAKLDKYALGGTKEGLENKSAQSTGHIAPTLLGKDQFGNGIDTDAITAFATTATVTANPDAANGPKVNVTAGTTNGTAGGVVTVDDSKTADGSGPAVTYVEGSTFEATLSTGQVFKLTVKTGGAAGAAVFTASLS